MKISDLPFYQPKERAAPVRHELPATPAASLTGPDVISGTVRDVDGGLVQLWNDPMCRWIKIVEPTGVFVNALANGIKLEVTTEKLKGRWVVTSVKEI